MKPHKPPAAIAFLFMGLLLSGSTSLYAEDSIKIWTPTPPMTMSANTSDKKVKPEEVIQMSATAFDMDIWTRFTPGQSEGAISGGNYLDSGTEEDRWFLVWTHSGGEWLDGSTETMKFWKAPKRGGEYEVTVTADDAGVTADSGSRDDEPIMKTLTIKVRDTAQVKAVEVVDNNDTSRKSFKFLQMVSSGSRRSATATAFKDDSDLVWAESEPEWSGLARDEGVDHITITTAGSGRETATTRTDEKSIEKFIDIEILDGQSRELSLSGLDAMDYVQLVNGLSDNIGTGPKLYLGMTLSHSGQNVDTIGSPLCGVTAEYSSSGAVGLTWTLANFKPKIVRVIIPEQLKKYVDYECDVQAGFRVAPTIEIVKDGTHDPAEWGNSTGYLAVTGYVSVEAMLTAKDPFFGRFEGEASAAATVTGGGKGTVIDAVLVGDYYIGRSELSVAVKFIDNNTKFSVEGDVTFVLSEGYVGDFDYDFKKRVGKG